MWRLRKESEMTRRKKTAPDKSKNRKLALKRETIKDLDVKGKARNVKGGVPIVQYTVMFCTTVCLPPANRK